MARVTVEDCIEKVENRFELILLAAHRTRSLLGGAKPLLPQDNDKTPVLALREIAAGCVAPHDLKEEFIHSMQRLVEVDEPESEVEPRVVGSSEEDDSFRDEDEDGAMFDNVSEEELLRGLSSMTPLSGNSRGED